MQINCSQDAFEFEVNTEKDGVGCKKTAVPFHLYKQSIQLNVDWGDGKEDLLTSAMYNAESAKASEHEYAEPGRYRVAVRALNASWDNVYISTLDCQDAEFETSEGFNAKTECIRLFKKTLVEIPVPLPNFGGAWEFFSTDPSKLTDGIPVKDNFSYLFLHCSSLEKICDGLFKNNRNSICFSYTFYGCRSLKDIPADLFKGCTKVQAFTYCFFGCSSLQCIPEDLFASSYKAKSFKGCFKDCSKLKGIPERLFNGNPLAELFTECFQNCTCIESIPENLFSKTPAALSFSRAFENCSMLKAIPANIFKNTKCATFFKGVFSKTAIKSIPSKLFSECRHSITFAYAFSWCPFLETVPGDLFRNCTWIESFFGCFYGCIELKSVGKELLCSSIFAKTLNSMFYGCRSLTKVELDIPLRRLESVTLMFEFDSDSDRVMFVPKLSSTAKLFRMKESDLGIKVKDKMFIGSTFKAIMHSLGGRFKN